MEPVVGIEPTTDGLQNRVTNAYLIGYLLF